MSTELGYVRYHTKICNEIRSRYVECSKRKQEINKELTALRSELSDFMDGKKVLTYAKYTDVKNSIDWLSREAADLDIRIAVWDEAREICLNVIYDTDEV